MDIVYKIGETTVAEVQENLPDAPSYSTVRTLLRILKDKGYLKHRELGPKYVYFPTIAPEKAKISALMHLMQTLFDDSAERVFAAILDIKGTDLSEENLDKLSRLIQEAKKEGK